MSLLSTHGLTAFHRDFQALYGLDLAFEAGDTVAIIGANGAGKSMLLKTLAGLLPAPRDAVMFGGEPIGGLPAPEILKRGIALVPKGRKPFPSLSVEGNLRIGGDRRKDAGPWSLQAVYDLFPVLRERRRNPGTALSGGQQQMVAFSRALPLMFALGYALQYLLLNRVVGRDAPPPLLIAFGLAIVTQNGLLAAFSADSRRISAGGWEGASLPLADGLAVDVLPLMTLATAIAVIVALNQLFYRTKIGRAFRAVSDDPVTAQLMGIDNRKVFALAMGLALAVSAIAALFLGVRANFDPSIGPARLIFAFEAVIIGGLGSLWGTLAGGVLLGIARTFGIWGAFGDRFGWRLFPVQRRLIVRERTDP